MRRAAAAGALSALLLVTAASALAGRASHTVSARDRTGEVDAVGVDIAAATMTRSDGTIVARIVLTQPAADEVRYSAELAVGATRWRLEATRSGGRIRFAAVRLEPTVRRFRTRGAFVGRSVSIRVPAKLLGASTAAFRFWFAAEVTGGAYYAEDRLPDDERPLLVRLASPLARSLRFPRG